MYIISKITEQIKSHGGSSVTWVYRSTQIKEASKSKVENPQTQPTYIASSLWIEPS